MKLYAISDVHVGFGANRRALAELSPHPADWIIVAGDVAEAEQDFSAAMDQFASKFDKVLWTPGNHELWTLPDDPSGLRGAAKYDRLVEICRARGIVTPEDPYPVWPGTSHVIVPLFLLYDYSFRPDHVPLANAIAWAEETGVLCTDEAVLFPDPYPSRQAWCAALCERAENRLAALPQDVRTILVNHYPLLYEDVTLPLIPRFSIWCGTQATRDWPRRFRADVVVYGHLHVRTTRVREGVRYEEVSLGYPRQWRSERGLESHLREIMPGPVRA